MHNKIAGILTIAAIVTASAALADPVHYAMAVAETNAASRSLPAKAYTALAGDVDAARADALAQCRDATKRDCVVIGTGEVAHTH